MSSNFDSILKTIVTIYNRGIVQEGKSMGMMVDIVDMVYATHRGRGGAVLDRGTQVHRQGDRGWRDTTMLDTRTLQEYSP